MTAISRRERRLQRLSSSFSSSILSESTTIKEDPVFAWLGTAAHIISLLGTLRLACAFVRSNRQQQLDQVNASVYYATILDEQWKKHGFCINNYGGNNDSKWNTHEICCRIDIVAAGLLAFLHMSTSKTMRRANDLLAPLVLGLLALGVGHGLLGLREATWEGGGGAIQQRTQHEVLDEKTLEENLVLQLPSVLFWGGCLTRMMKRETLPSPSTAAFAMASKSRAPTTTTTKKQTGFLLQATATPWNNNGNVEKQKQINWTRAASSAAVSNIMIDRVLLGILAVAIHFGQLLLPVQFGFFYVQLALSAIFSLHQIFLVPHTSKDFVFCTFAVIVMVPLTAVKWLESTQCSDPFVQTKLGGHVLCHACFVGTLLSWYLLNYLHMAGSVSMAKSIKKTVKFL